MRELGRDFSKTNPSLAGLFAERGADPDVERLMEGFAFMTARVRERIDDAVPEVVEQLCQLALPQFVRSVPATSVVQFTPSLQSMRGSAVIPKGAELGSRPVDGVSCPFSTTRDLTLLPLEVASATLDSAIESAPRIRLGFRTTEAAKDAVRKEGKIRLFLHGPPAQASMLFLWLSNHLVGTTLTSADGGIQRLGKDAVTFPALLEGGSVYPWPEYAPDDLRLMLEYYSEPGLLLFVDVSLGELAHAPTETFDVVFQFKSPPKLPERITADAFRLHAVPVVNLFETSAEPIRRELRANEYLVRATGLSPTQADVYDVVRVSGSKSGRSTLGYDSYFGFTHATKPEAEQRFHWTRRALSPIDGGLDTYVAFGRPGDLPPDDTDEVISMDLLCTNRGLPKELRVGDISTKTPKSPGVAPFSNILPVSRPVAPPLGTELHWRFVAHTALNQRSLSNPEALKALLRLYNVQQAVDVQLGRANELRVSAIRDVSMKPAKRLVDHVPTRGVETTIEVEETAFAELGDLHLFGCTLDAFFGAQAPINTFHQLRLRAHPSGTELSWTPRSGIEPIF